MTRPSSLISRNQHAALAPITGEALQPHSDLTFKALDNLTIDGANMRHSLLNGCLIRNCTFRNVDMSRCDLEQVQFLKCNFENVNFGNVELTSTHLSGCRFDRCIFESALISECVWQQCKIVGCSFVQSVVHLSRFEGCELQANNLQGASVQLDTFRGCLFEDMTLGDCTFLNQLLIDCRYQRVRINAESIGSLFGISEQDLHSLELVYLGQPVVEIESGGHLLDALERDYEQRHWYFMREMLRLNFNRRSRVVALEGCLEAVLWPASLGAPLKSGDITFLEMVILELFRRQELPGASALELPERIMKFKGASRGDPESNDSLKLQQLASRLRGLFLDMLREVGPAVESLGAERKDQCVTARMIFEKKPENDVVEFVRHSARSSGLRVNGMTAMIREETGSYILVLQTTLITLAGFQMALWLLNGCVAQVIELRARTKIALQRRSPTVIRERVLLPDQHIPKWMAGAIQGIFAKLTANPTSLDRTAIDFEGKNLRVIEISKTSESRKRGRTTRQAG